VGARALESLAAARPLPHHRAMKKLAIIASLAIAAPVFACPGHDSDETAPRTAEKDKKETPAPKQDKAKETDKAKPTDNKTAKPADKDKKPDKVSSK
jgi:hypothetical protein